jgi:UDP-N-acetylmuramate dehydrogenase
MTGGPEEYVRLASHTTLGLGGPARWFWAVTTGPMLIEALRWARDTAAPLSVLGGGSNVIVPDEGLDGLVVKVALPGVRIEPAAADGTALVHVGAGESWDALVSAVVAEGLQGLECLSGIPGYAGATPIQNVGAYGQEVADTITTLLAVDRATLAPVEFAAAECGFGYRASRFKGADRDRFIITEVTFRLRVHAPPALRYPELRRAVEAIPDYSSLAPAAALGAVRAAVLTLRRRKSMVVDAADPNTRSVGSFFMNPVLDDPAVERLRQRWSKSAGSDDIPLFPAGPGSTKVSAAWLVEQTGFPRGTRRGGVGVSPNHALALVNLGGTSAELLALALEIRTAVEARFGVTLEREPVVLGAA